ncbi:unnamed protein product [Prorocentrum cordatum]|uniref:Uncharacterized protein n=1 Tax=Prorocentrum cordatum TaxID=2364126 RepID=A0ABN9RZ88_9DINO|nr:unnamed protein product [Polarella glacialis]
MLPVAALWRPHPPGCLRRASAFNLGHFVPCMCMRFFGQLSSFRAPFDAPLLDLRQGAASEKSDHQAPSSGLRRRGPWRLPRPPPAGQKAERPRPPRTAFISAGSAATTRRHVVSWLAELVSSVLGDVWARRSLGSVAGSSFVLWRAVAYFNVAEWARWGYGSFKDAVDTVESFKGEIEQIVEMHEPGALEPLYLSVGIMLAVGFLGARAADGRRPPLWPLRPRRALRLLLDGAGPRGRRRQASRDQRFRETKGTASPDNEDGDPMEKEVMKPPGPVAERPAARPPSRRSRPRPSRRLQRRGRRERRRAELPLAGAAAPRTTT